MGMVEAQGVRSEVRWCLTQVGSLDDGGTGIAERSSGVGDGGAVGQGSGAEDGGGGVSMGSIGHWGTSISHGGSSVGQRRRVSQGSNNSSGGDGQDGEEGDLKKCIQKLMKSFTNCK
jgi:hypothetical protein